MAAIFSAALLATLLCATVFTAHFCTLLVTALLVATTFAALFPGADAIVGHWAVCAHWSLRGLGKG
ncbi:MAG: hypothetical protein WAK26_12130 [Terracidiphilus sp.]